MILLTAAIAGIYFNEMKVFMNSKSTEGVRKAVNRTKYRGGAQRASM